MSVFKCKMCGGDLDVKQDDTIVECSYCGTNQTVPSANTTEIKVVINKDGKEDDASIETTIDYVLLLIEDGELYKAEKLLEQVISKVPKHPMIYIAKLLIECGVKKQEDLALLEDDFTSSSNYQKAIRFAGPALKTTLEGYVSAVKQNGAKKIYNQAVAKMNSSQTAIELNLAENMFNSVSGYADAKELALVCKEKANEAKKEAIYQMALTAMNKTGVNQLDYLNKAKEGFSSIKDYKDSELQIDACERLIFSLEQKKKRKQKIRVIIAVIIISVLLAVLAVEIVIFGVIAPKNNYALGEELFEQKKYEQAYEAYDAAGNYKDAEEKAKECLYIIGNILKNQKRWEDANYVFEHIKDYKDSASLIHKCNLVEVASRNPTCEKAGYKQFKCKDCGVTTQTTYDAKGHKYTEATCTTPQKCKECGKTNGKALGHKSGGTTCARCGAVTFKTLTYSGNGSTVKNNINLPKGKFRITCTLYSGSYTTMYFYNGTTENLIFNHYNPNTTEITTISGPINNASLVVNGESGYAAAAKWKVTIEAIG